MAQINEVIKCDSCFATTNLEPYPSEVPKPRVERTPIFNVTNFFLKLQFDCR